MGRRHVSELLRRTGRAVALGAVGLVVSAGPAAADPPAPGDYSSEVTGVEPAADGFTIEVVGGDSFLLLTVDPGTEVVVLGYEGEPYLRVGDDGTVERNRNSPATYLNDDRYAEVDIPAALVGVDVADLDPDWERVGSGGEYAWHDHRIHWMAPNSPPAVARGESFSWNGPVELLVDGDPVAVSGRITYAASVSPVPFAAVGLVAAAVGVVALRRRVLAAAGLGAVVAVGAAAVSWATYDTAPAGVGASVVPVVVAAVGVACSVLGGVAPPGVRPLFAFAAASVLGAWGLLRIDVLTNPVLPTSAPFSVDRVVTALALGGALVVGVAGLAALTPAEPTPDDDR